MFKPKNFGWADLVVLIAFECIAVPICIAAGEAFVSESYGRAIFGWLVGIPLAVAGFTAPWWMGWLSEPVRASIRRQTLRWWPAAIFLAFLYVTGPHIFVAASWSLIAIVAGFVIAVAAATVFAARAADSSLASPPKVTQQIVATDGQTQLDLVHLLDFAVNQTTVLWLTDLIMKAPTKIATGSLVLNGDLETAQASAEFVRHISVNLGSGTFRYQDFLGWMTQAEAEAEKIIEETPQNIRPSGIDPLVVRRCAIANLQCIRAMAFLQAERREVERRLVAQRSKLLEQLRLRNPS